MNKTEIKNPNRRGAWQSLNIHCAPPASLPLSVAISPFCPFSHPNHDIVSCFSGKRKQIKINTVYIKSILVRFIVLCCFHSLSPHWTDSKQQSPCPISLSPITVPELAFSLDLSAFKSNHKRRRFDQFIYLFLSFCF